MKMSKQTWIGLGIAALAIGGIWYYRKRTAKAADGQTPHETVTRNTASV